MTNWKEYKLGELIETVSKTFKFSDKKVVFLNTSDTLEGKVINHNLFEPKKLPGQAKKTIQPYDILYSEIRPANKRYAFVDFDSSNYVVSTKLMVLRVLDKEIISPKYLYYFLTSDEIVSYLQMLAESRSGTFPQIRFEEVSLLDIKLPPLNVQNEIVELVASLDDKIELNNKINQELENLAQTLFKQWFIDFEFPNENGEPYKSSGGEMVDSELGEIPKGWELKKLGELVKKSNTGADAIKRAPIVNEDTGVRCVRVGDMTNKRPFDEWGFCKITPEDYKRYKLDINDIVVTRTATLGINTIIRNEIKGVYNNGLIRLKMDENKIIPLLAYCFFQSDAYKIWIERISGDSSTRPNMQINYLLDFPMYQCPISIQKKFIEQASVIFENLENNILENKELIQLRDTLLPKLISGELEVSDALTQTIA